jgi:hypothetical protein
MEPVFDCQKNQLPVMEAYPAAFSEPAMRRKNGVLGTEGLNLHRCICGVHGLIDFAAVALAQACKQQFVSA